MPWSPTHQCKHPGGYMHVCTCTRVQYVPYSCTVNPSYAPCSPCHVYTPSTRRRTRMRKTRTRRPIRDGVEERSGRRAPQRSQSGRAGCAAEGAASRRRIAIVDVRVLNGSGRGSTPSPRRSGSPPPSDSPTVTARARLRFLREVKGDEFFTRAYL